MKAITILLIGLICISLIVGVYSYKQSKETLKINNIEINSADFDSIFQPLPEGKYIFCSMKEEDKNSPCALMFKGNTGVK